MSSLLKWHKGGLKTPLSRAHGLGSAKTGAQIWLMERVTSIALTILGIWFLCTVICNRSMTYTEAMLWMSQPINAVMMILLVIVGFYHSLMGVTVVIEDYVHTEWRKLSMLITLKLVFLALAVATIFGILQIAL